MLIVADQPLANLVALTLNHGKYLTRIAKTPQIARAEFDSWRPHLLLVDLDAHDSDSLELIGQRIANQRIPTIALSRRGDLRTKLVAFDRGVDDIIIAPDKSVSYLIIGAGAFVGLGRHDVAIPIDQIIEQAGEIVLPGATKDVIKALPAFDYAKDRN